MRGQRHHGDMAGAALFRSLAIPRVGQARLVLGLVSTRGPELDGPMRLRGLFRASPFFGEAIESRAIPPSRPECRPAQSAWREAPSLLGTVRPAAPSARPPQRP